MENYLGYSKAEMIADYNSDFYNSLVKKTKAAKYKLDSKTVQGIVSYVSQLATYMVIDHKDQICYPIRANGDEINVEISFIQ